MDLNLDSLIWEECQADLAYDNIAKESSIHDFLGFEPLTSTPAKTQFTIYRQHHQ